MKAFEKIKFMRQLQGLTQEEMAEKLGISLKGYSDIERGKTNLQVSRVEEIAKALNINLLDMLSFGEKNVYYNQTNFENNAECKNQIEKLELIIEQKNKELHLKDKEISLLEKQNEDLRAMLDFLKK